jgi:hypothetical protein
MKISDWNLERRWTRNWDVGMGKISQVEGHHFLLILHDYLCFLSIELQQE